MLLNRKNGHPIRASHCKRDTNRRHRITHNLTMLTTECHPHEQSGSWYTRRGKRIFDICAASLLILMLSPLLVTIALLIKLDSPGPVIFKQHRTGFLGRRFRMYKFRTMVKNAESLKEHIRHLSHHSPDSPDFKITADPRISRIGRFLRKSSLDELPNLFNVIRGDLSLVGPRPTSFDFDKYKDHHLARLAVKPGMTGLWQISGRSELDFDDRVKLDRIYIEKQSFWFDMMILLKTPLKVIDGAGAY